MPKRSISTFLKKHSAWGGPYTAIVEAVKVHAAQGDHPDIAFEGNALELATALYLEHAKKAGAAGGLYCTLPAVARKMAESLDLKPGQVVLNPGSGLHALTRAVREVAPEATLICVECQDWLVQLSEAAAWTVIPGDMENVTFAQSGIDAVIVNPPWGKLWGSNNAEREFMSRIVAITRPGVKVVALLPGSPGEFFEKLPPRHKGIWLAFTMLTEGEFYPNGAALPKSIPCTRYLLERI